MSIRKVPYVSDRVRRLGYLLTSVNIEKMRREEQATVGSLLLSVADAILAVETVFEDPNLRVFYEHPPDAECDVVRKGPGSQCSCGSLRRVAEARAALSKLRSFRIDADSLGERPPSGR